MKNCTSCNAENQDDAERCFLCGQPLKKPGLLKRIFGGGGRRASQAETPYTRDSHTAPTERADSAERPTPVQTPPVDATPSAQDFKQRGADYLNKGQYQLSIDANSEAIRLDPDYTDAYYNRALAYIRLQQYHQAAQDLDRAIALNSSDPDAYHNRAYAYFMQHQLDRSIEDYDRSIQLNTNNAEVFIGRGAAYFERGDYLKSIDDFDRAISLGNPPHAYANRAVSYVRLERYSEAEADIKRAEEMGSDPAKAKEELRRRRR